MVTRYHAPDDLRAYGESLRVMDAPIAKWGDAILEALTDAEDVEYLYGKLPDGVSIDELVAHWDVFTELAPEPTHMDEDELRAWFSVAADNQRQLAAIAETLSAYIGDRVDDSALDDIVAMLLTRPAQKTLELPLVPLPPKLRVV